MNVTGKHTNLKIIILILSCIGIGVWLFVPQTLFKDPYSFVLQDKDGKLLGAHIAEDGQWRFPLIDSIPKTWENAILKFEDQRFYSHIGVDPLAIVRAIIENVKSEKIVSGASTISMQVIRLSRKGKPRNFYQKIIEAILAIRLEMQYSKQEILRLYASHAPFGGNVVGLEAASWRYYHKSPHMLSLAEASTLAVLPNSPALIHPGRNRSQLKAKRDGLIRQLLEAGLIDTTEYELSLLEKLPEAPLALPQLAPHLLHHLNEIHDNASKFSSTIDYTLQQNLIDITNDHYLINKGSDIHNIAVLVADTKTGKILSYIGNAHLSKNQNAVDIIHSRRSSGSVLKPILYAHLIEEGEILPKTLIADIPVQIRGFKPKNYYRSYTGAVPADEALSRSLNIPFVLLLQQYGVEKFIKDLRAHNISSIDRSAENYGLSLILGGAEISLFDLTQSYASMGAILLNHDDRNNSSSTRKPYKLSYSLTEESPGINTQHLLSPASIYLTFEALRKLSRPDTEGQWQQFSSSRPIAWKTGTSYGHRDAWAVGVTPEYTIGVWVGNADGEGKHGLVGVKKAAPVLFDVLNQLPATSWFDLPADELYLRETCINSGHLAGRYCEARDTSLLVSNFQKTAPCPYHKNIHLDNEGFLAQSDCTPTFLMKQYNWFVLPPVQAHYYRQSHPEYKVVPAGNPSCTFRRASKELNPIAFIYPSETSKIYLPIDGDGEKNSAVFKAAHEHENSVIHWHLDEEYLGSTEEIHAMEINSTPGKHTVLLVDQWGNETQQTFEIVY